jgi:hypothetical protein
MTHSIMTHSIMTHIIMTHIIMTLSIMTLSIMEFHMAICNAILSIMTLNAIAEMLSVVLFEIISFDCGILLLLC